MNKELSLKNYIRFFIITMMLITALTVTSEASAEPDETGIVTIFCNVINEITGGIGKVISVLILISMAIGLFLGKITWGLAIAVMVGMGLLFGAKGLVDLIASGTDASQGETAKSLCSSNG